VSESVFAVVLGGSGGIILLSEDMFVVLPDGVVVDGAVVAVVGRSRVF